MAKIPERLAVFIRDALDVIDENEIRAAVQPLLAKPLKVIEGPLGWKNRLLAILPTIETDAALRKKFHLATTHRFDNDPNRVVAWMAERFAAASKRKPIENPNAYAMTILTELLDDDGWDFFGDAS